MPRFTIMHIYEVPARNQYEATNELMTGALRVSYKAHLLGYKSDPVEPGDLRGPSWS